MSGYQRIDTTESIANSSIVSQPTTSIFSSADPNQQQSAVTGSSYPDDQRPLLSSANTSLYQNDDPEVLYEESPPSASPISCAVNLVNTILGTGLLAMVLYIK